MMDRDLGSEFTLEMTMRMPRSQKLSCPGGSRGASPILSWSEDQKTSPMVLRTFAITSFALRGDESASGCEKERDDVHVSSRPSC